MNRTVWHRHAIHSRGCEPPAASPADSTPVLLAARRPGGEFSASRRKPQAGGVCSPTATCGPRPNVTAADTGVGFNLRIPLRLAPAVQVGLRLPDHSFKFQVSSSQVSRLRVFAVLSTPRGWSGPSTFNLGQSAGAARSGASCHSWSWEARPRTRSRAGICRRQSPAGNGAGVRS